MPRGQLNAVNQLRIGQSLFSIRNHGTDGPAELRKATVLEKRAQSIVVRFAGDETGLLDKDTLRFWHDSWMQAIDWEYARLMQWNFFRHELSPENARHRFGILLQVRRLECRLLRRRSRVAFAEQ